MSDNRREALEALRDKVKAGAWDTKSALKALPESHVSNGNDWVDPIGWASCAFHNGSLDAAKALHDAVLPGPLWLTFCGDGATIGVNGEEYTGKADNPARAWLLAILSALISETPKGETP